MLLEVFPPRNARMRRDIHGHIQTHMHNTNTQTCAPRHTYSFSLDVPNLCEPSTANFPFFSFLLYGSLPYLLFLILIIFLLISSSEHSVEFCFHRFVLKSQQDLTMLFIYTTHHTHEYVHNLHTHATSQRNKQTK